MMLTSLAIILALTVVAGLARLATLGPAPSRVDAVALTLAVLAPAAALWDVPAGPAATIALLCAGLWFLWRVVAPRRAGTATTPGSGRGAAVYRLLFTACAWWITSSLASVHALGPGGQLGNIMLYMFAAVALIFSTAAWLLSSFALPEGPGGKIRPILGIHEALAAAVVALCFFTLV